MKIRFAFAALAAVLAASFAHSVLADPTPIKDVLAQIDPATGKAKDTTTAYTVSGIVAAKLTLPDDRIVAFVVTPGEAALPVLADAKDGANLMPRNAVTLSGKLADGPLGAALAADAGSVQAGEANKPFGNSEPRGAAFFADASSLAGRYVQLTNVTFEAAKFDTTGTATVKGADGAEVKLLVGKGAAGRDVPEGATDVFGVALKNGGQWELAAARFLPVTRKEALALAQKSTCINCHNPDIKVVGPAYRDVAAKYRNDPDAQTKLISQMETGGFGKWGTVPMTPFKGIVAPDDMKKLADWILGYRWDAILAE
jgi:cytochrome c551/c552